MPAQNLQSEHTFHIPVMGTGFTIDTPLRVAKYGISSVISLVDDILIEQMRKFHCQKEEVPYEEIPNKSEDGRALRITAYLNLIDRLLQRQVKALQSSVFEKGSEINKYYEMLPETSEIKAKFRKMATMTDDSLLNDTKKELRARAVPGSIDVNIMTKLDRDNYRSGEKLPEEFSDAMAALRGFAQSTLRSSIIFSAGINKRLYRYMTKFDDFFPDKKGHLKKKIVIKVSDFRSAEIQGRFLAKLGLWVSEYRIESGLNCGGHAFASKGHLIGVILQEFKEKRGELFEKLAAIYMKALSGKNQGGENPPAEFKITVQGGVGTADEHQFLLQQFDIDSVGWGTPFMLVPEATNMDEVNLKRLAEASAADVYLSESSPLGVPFWNMRTSSSENARRARIQEGRPGSPCPKGFAVTSTEFTEKPICLAARMYQKKKLQHLPSEGHLPQLLTTIKENILAKACICHDLAGNATAKLGIDPDATSAVCCGPGIVDFSKIATLEEMISHIYGRLSLLTSTERPHMFIRELSLYMEHLHKEIETLSSGLSSRTTTYLQEMRENLLNGIEYYKRSSSHLVEECRGRFLEELEKMQLALDPIRLGLNGD